MAVIARSSPVTGAPSNQLTNLNSSKDVSCKHRSEASYYRTKRTGTLPITELFASSSFSTFKHKPGPVCGQKCMVRANVVYPQFTRGQLPRNDAQPPCLSFESTSIPRSFSHMRSKLSEEAVRTLVGEDPREMDED